MKKLFLILGNQLFNPSFMNDYKKDHKWTTVNFELKFWATVGQLKLLSEDYIKSLHIVVHSPIGKMEL